MPSASRILLLLVLLGLGWAAEPSAQQGVLVLYSDARLLPAMVAIDEELRAAVGGRRPGSTAYYNEFIDTVRFPLLPSQQRFAEFLHEKYRDHRIDVIVCVRDAAFEFALANRGTLLPEVPLLHLGVDGGTLRRHQLPADVVGLPVEIDAGPQLALLHRLQPRCAQIVVVGGESDLERHWAAAFRHALAGEPLPVRWLPATSLQEVELEVATLPADAALLLAGGLYRDQAGNSYVPAESCRRIVQASSAPAYVCYSTMVGTGAVGGAVFDVPALAVQTGQALVRLLDGQAPATLALPVQRPETIILDWRQVQRWGLSAQAVPGEARVMFREASFWERYRWWITAAVVVIVLQALLISSLLVGRRRLQRARAAAAAEAQRLAQVIGERQLLQAHAAQQQDQLTHLARVSSLGELSSSIAHELNQPLTAILSNAQAGTRFLAQADPDLVEIRDILGDIAGQSRRAGEVIRRMRAMLRKDAPRLVELDLRQVVEDVLSMVRSDLVVRGITCRTELGAAPLLVHGDRVQLQQVLINLALNACDALAEVAPERRELSIALAPEGRWVACAVADHGPGVPPQDLERIFETFVSTKPQGIGMGLSICRSILASHGGTLVAANNPAGGATFRFALPALSTEEGA